MFAPTLVALAGLVHTLFRLASYLLIARIVMSWLQPRPASDLLRSLVLAVYRLTDPVLDGARRAMPFLRVGALDLSPIVVFLALGFADQVITGSLYQAAAGLG